MERRLTGTLVFAITAGAFAIIIGVNVLMAVKAVTTFPGLEVANSYVASQTFDRDRKAQEALGWRVAEAYAPGRLTLAFTDRAGRPADLRDLSVTVGRATEDKDDRVPEFRRDGAVWAADLTLAPGKWVLYVEARAADGTAYRKRLSLSVRG